jgi:hypothetical protein
MTRRKRFCFRVLMLVLSAGSSLVVSELYLRTHGAQPSPPIVTVSEPLYEPDPVLGWRNKEGRFLVRVMNSAGAAPYRVTNLANGRRATEREGVNPRRKVVALVGCSFTQGQGISDDETYAWWLQQKHPGVELRNYGTGGYGTYQSLLLLERLFRGPKSEHPSVVVYGFIGSHEERNVATADWMQNLYRYSDRGHVDVPFCTLEASGTLRRHEPERYQPLPLSGQLAAVARLEIAIARLATLSRNAQKRGVTEKLILEMRDLCRSNGAEFAVAILLANGEKKAHYIRFYRTNQIDFVDCARGLAPEFQVPGEGHPNGKLNSLWAASLDLALGPRLISLSSSRSIRK